MLLRRTPTGQAFCRYDMDGYGEWIDGSGWPVHGFGVGRPWPLLVGERGHHDVLVGRDPTPRLEAMLAMRGDGGLLPEQVWDAGDLPWRHLVHGGPTGSAMPLAWAHSELVKLAVVASTGGGRPVELLTAVADRYPDQQPRRTTTWYWRDNGPVQHLPAGCELVVEDTRPFTLHFAFDGWKEGTLAERRAEEGRFGMYAVPLTAEQLAGRADLQFTRRRDDGSWEGTDHTVVLGVPVTTPRALTVPPVQYAGRLPYPARR
jgi:glucoamylase